MLSSLQALNRKATRPKGVANDAFARPPNLPPTLCDLELLHRRRYNIIGIYHNICLPGLVEIRQTVLGIFHRKFFDTHFDPEWPLPSNCRPPKFIISCPRPTDDSCAKWYQKCLFNILNTSSLTDKQMDNLITLCLHLPVWPGRGIKALQYKEGSNIELGT